MTSNDVKLAVISINNTLATNNPKGLTDALRRNGYVVDGRFDILNYDALNNALLELYITNPEKWGEVIRSVPFNYQKTDSSTSPETKALFENISTALDPSGATRKTKAGGFFDKALELILGSTTTTTYGGGSAGIKAKISPWVYAGLIILGLGIVALVIFAIKKV